MDYRIAIIIPNTPAYETAKKLLEKKHLDYPLYKASGSEAVEIAESLIKKGTRLIISTGFTYSLLQEKLSIPLIELPFSSLDAAIAIKKASSYSNRIVHIGTKKLFHYLIKSVEFLGIDEDSISFYELTPGKTLEEQTVDAISKGFDVIIGGYIIAKTARQYGKHGIEVDVDESVIEAAVRNGQELIVRMIEEEQQHMLEKVILQTTSDGIIALNNDQHIILANPAAEKIIGIDPVGLSLKDAFEKNNVVDIDAITIEQIEHHAQYTPIVLNESPIEINNEQIGSVISIKSVSELHEMSYKTRNDLFVKGLWAEHTFESIKGSSKAITLAKEKAQIYAKYNSPVLIFGETGTGKELFAQSIHNSSRRKMQPWVPVNCASLPENLIESELFGYVKGAFTGANKEGKMGFFELADGGTIFLDEISELPISIQSKLLRVIQEGDVIRVGGDKIIHVDVRVICSSNKDLIKLIKGKKFKEDLFYRLSVLEIKLPPLRERPDDIEALCYTFLKKFNEIHGKNITSITPDALSAIKSFPLMGNVRELSNIIERMVIFTNENEINKQVLLNTIEFTDTSASEFFKLNSDTAQQYDPEARTDAESRSSNLKNAEKEIILKTLEENNGNKAATARALGIDPSTLWRKLKKYDI